MPQKWERAGLHVDCWEAFSGFWVSCAALRCVYTESNFTNSQHNIQSQCKDMIRCVFMPGNTNHKMWCCIATASQHWDFPDVWTLIQTWWSKHLLLCVNTLSFYNTALCTTGLCDEHRPDAIKFFNMSETATADTVQQWLLSAAVNDRQKWDAPLPPDVTNVPTVAVCGHTVLCDTTF